MKNKNAAERDKNKTTPQHMWMIVSTIFSVGAAMVFFFSSIYLSLLAESIFLNILIAPLAASVFCFVLWCLLNTDVLFRDRNQNQIAPRHVWMIITTLVSLCSAVIGVYAIMTFSPAALAGYVTAWQVIPCSMGSVEFYLCYWLCLNCDFVVKHTDLYRGEEIKASDYLPIGFIKSCFLKAPNKRQFKSVDRGSDAALGTKEEYTKQIITLPYGKNRTAE